MENLAELLSFGEFFMNNQSFLPLNRIMSTEKKVIITRSIPSIPVNKTPKEIITMMPKSLTLGFSNLK